MAQTLVPKHLHNVPSLNHTKTVLYNEYVLINNTTVTEEPFYVDWPFTFVTSDAPNTTLYKWNGGGWTEIKGWSNPDCIGGKGFFAVTTAANAYVLITEQEQ